MARRIIDEREEQTFEVKDEVALLVVNDRTADFTGIVRKIEEGRIGVQWFGVPTRWLQWHAPDELTKVIDAE